MLDKSMFKSPNLRLEQELAGDGAAGDLVCPGCKRVVSQAVLKEEFYQCARCGYAHKMGARQRVNMILDEGSFEELDAGLASYDPLAFPQYREKLAQAREASGENEAVITGLGRIQGLPCAFFAS